MKWGPSRQTCVSTANQDTAYILWNFAVPYHVTAARHLSTPTGKSVHSRTSHSLSLRRNLTSSSHLCIARCRNLFPSDLPTKILYEFLRCLMREEVGGGAAGWGTALKACSIPNGVISIFYWPNPSGCTMALGLTQFLTEIYTVGWRRSARRSHNLCTSFAAWLEILGASTSWSPQGPYRDSFYPCASHTHN